MQGEHEGQAPALRLLGRLRVELRDGVGEVGLGGGDGVAAEVRELGDLVGEHLLDGLGLQDAGGGLGGLAAVEEGGEEFCGGRLGSGSFGIGGSESVLQYSEG